MVDKTKAETITSFDLNLILNFIAEKEKLGYKLDIGQSQAFFSTVTVTMVLDETIEDADFQELKSKVFEPEPLEVPETVQVTVPEKVTVTVPEKVTVTVQEKVVAAPKTTKTKAKPKA